MSYRCPETNLLMLTFRLLLNPGDVYENLPFYRLEYKIYCVCINLSVDKRPEPEPK